MKLRALTTSALIISMLASSGLYLSANANTKAATTGKTSTTADKNNTGLNTTMKGNANYNYKSTSGNTNSNLNTNTRFNTDLKTFPTSPRNVPMTGQQGNTTLPNTMNPNPAIYPPGMSEPINAPNTIAPYVGPSSVPDAGSSNSIKSNSKTPITLP